MRFLLSTGLVLYLAASLGYPSGTRAQTDSGSRLPGSEPLQTDAKALSMPLDSVVLSPQLLTIINAAVGAQMEVGHTPGAVVVIVKDTSIVFAKGYGYANLERRVRVTIDSTSFYVASVTKPFTATAALQLVEKGLINPNADVNSYLKTFKIPDAFGAPITLAHLLVHTAGFEDRNIGYVAATPAEAEAEATAAYLSRALPQRVMTPGLFSSYSNYDYGIVGLLIENASGETYADYLERHVFLPIGMTRSSAQIPVPAKLSGYLATGYDMDYIADRLIPQPLGYRKMPGAGSVTATAVDVAKFMIAHLNGGANSEGRLLSPETLAYMHATQYSPHPKLPGMAFGLFDRKRGSKKTLEHGGAYIGFSTYLALVPEERLGIFVAVNKTAGGSSQIAGALLDGLYPPIEPGPLSEPVIRGEALHPFVGMYHSTKYSRSSVEKIAVWDSFINVTASEDQLWYTAAQGGKVAWQAVAPDLFRRTDKEEYLTFREQDGVITHLLYSQDGIATPLEKLSWADNVIANRAGLVALGAFWLLTLLGWPVLTLGMMLVRRIRGVARTSLSSKPAAFFAVAVSLMNVAFCLGLDIWLGNSGYRISLIYGMSREMVLLLWLPIISIPLTIGVFYYVRTIWKNGIWNRFGRVYYTGVALSCLAFYVFLYHWNLLGFNY